MSPDELKALVCQALPDAEVIVDGSGDKFQLTVVTDRFEGLRRVQKQQLIYQALGEHIASGAIHAVTMQTLTREEWRKARLFG